MKKKSASKLVRNSLREDGSAPARRSPWPAVVSRRRRLSEGAFFNLRVLVGFFFCVTGVLLGVFAGGDGALRRPDKPPRYMPAPGGDLHGEAAGLVELQQVLAQSFDVSYRPI